LGNEYNYHPEWFNNNINNWYTILNNAATAIHNADPDHPVSSAHGEVPASTVFGLCPAFDVWGMNVYRWDNPSEAITEFATRSTNPCYFSESGVDRYNNTQKSENQQQQSTADLTIWNNIKGHFDKCSGITFFEFADEWWKGGNLYAQDATGFAMSVPYDNFANEEWWGIVDINRNTTIAYDALKTAFNEYVTGTSDLAVPQEIILFPNPFNGSATFTFTVEKPSQVLLRVFDNMGKLVAEPVNKVELNGQHKVTWNAGDLPAGIYYARMLAGSQMKSVKMMKVK
jgi:hypothetical protein